MSLSWHLEVRDYKRAYWVALRPRRSYTLLAYIFLLPSFSFAVVLALSGSLDSRQQMHGLLCLAGCACLLVLFFVLEPRRLARLYRKCASPDYAADVLDDGLIFRNAGRETRLPWERISDWKPDRELILLYVSGKPFQILPRRAFPTDGDFDDLKHLLAEKAASSDHRALNKQTQRTAL